MPSLVTHVQFAKDLAVLMESHNQQGMISKALHEGAEILKLAEKYLQGNSAQEELRQKIADRSFSTGQDSSLVLPFIYSSSKYQKN